MYSLTYTYGKILLSLNPPPPVGVCGDPWREAELLLELGGVLGCRHFETAMATPNVHTRSVQHWLRHYLTNPVLHIRGQVCWALLQAMNLEAGAVLMQGAMKHFGLTSGDLQYFRIGMRSKQYADKYAACLLRQCPFDAWASIQEQTLRLSRLMAGLYSSMGDLLSVW